MPPGDRSTWWTVEHALGDSLATRPRRVELLGRLRPDAAVDPVPGWQTQYQARPVRLTSTRRLRQQQCGNSGASLTHHPRHDRRRCQLEPTVHRHQRLPLGCLLCQRERRLGGRRRRFRGGVILATTDGGTDWSVQYRVPVRTSTACHSPTHKTVGSRGTRRHPLYHDGGTDWTRQNWNATSTSHLSGVAFANANDGWQWR